MEWKEKGRNDWRRSVGGRSKGSASKWEGEEEGGGKGDGGGREKAVYPEKIKEGLKTLSLGLEAVDMPIKKVKR